MNIYLKAVLFIFIAFGVVLPSKAETACDDLLSITSLPDHEITALNVFTAFKNYFSSPDVLSSSNKKELVYTTRSGYALVSKCHPINRYERSMYYPIGLYGLHLGDEDITTDGQKVTYAHIMTEYGLNMYVPKENIDFLSKNSVYIFSNSNNPTPYCAGAPACTFKNGRELHPVLRFAKVDENQKDKIISDIKNNACGEYPITPIQSGNELTGEYNSSVSTCITAENGEIGLNGALKIVWDEMARDHMERVVKGSFSRLSPKLATKVMDVLAISNIKECSAEKDISETIKFGVSGKVPAEIFSAAGGLEKVAKYSSKLPGDYYFRTSAFSWNISDSSEFDVENIAFVSKCKDIRPFESLYIILYSKRFPNEQFQLLVEDLSDTYIKNLKLSGFHRNSDSNNLMQGRFWNIADHSQYFKWRGIIRYVLRISPQMTDFLMEYSPDKKEMIRDFITHIILASSFSYGIDPAGIKPEI